MAKAVGAGAVLQCDKGTAPSSLMVTRPTHTANSMQLANVTDFAPNTNIMPFLMCTTQTNPQVASATAAAQGVLTPQPCIPVTTSPWTPGATKVTVGGMAALTDGCSCMCMWGGKITVKQPGTQTVEVS